MIHDEALAAIAGHPHAWRFRQLCDGANPDCEQRDAYRRLVVRLARGEVPESPGPPVSYGDAAPPAAGGCCGGPPP